MWCDQISLDNVLKFLYKPPISGIMKVKDLKKKLTALGFYFLRQGGSHEVWSNGKISIAVPRHREIKETTAAGIIKQAGG